MVRLLPGRAGQLRRPGGGLHDGAGGAPVASAGAPSGVGRGYAAYPYRAMHALRSEAQREVHVPAGAEAFTVVSFLGEKVSLQARLGWTLMRNSVSSFADERCDSDAA